MFLITMLGVPLAVCVADGPVRLPPGGHRVHGHGQVDDVVPAEAQGLPLAPPRTPSHVGPLCPARTLHQVRRGHDIRTLLLATFRDHP